MSDLSRYRGKRNPGTTTEPFSAEHPGSEVEPDLSRSTQAGRFVVHQHAARRMHYDLRLPIGGVLSSFAVPQGPSLDPQVKRLAVRTEDHPAEYLDFEDTIAEGNYGAGAMIVWDTGGVTYNETSAEEGVRRGKIDFTLSGYKLSGRFALIATGRRKASTGLAGSAKATVEWLLIKKPDTAAVSGRDICEDSPRSVLSGMTVAELPQRSALAAEIVELAQNLGARRLTTPAGSFRPPMVCQSGEGPKSGAGWLYELKLDGVRIMAEKSEGQVKLRYRSGRTATRSYGEVTRAVRSLCLEHVILDGEIVAFDEQGRPRFSRLSARIRANKPRDIERAQQQTPVVYLAFDLLEVGAAGERWDLRDLAQDARNEVRHALLRAQGSVRNLDSIHERGDALWQLVEQQELEGMVAKRRAASYQHGPTASPDWVKIKRAEEHEFVLIGWTPSSLQDGGIGALLVASYEGPLLTYRGRVGSGMDRAARSELARELTKRERPNGHSAAADLPSDLVGPKFCKPELVVRVRHHGYSDGGHLQAAVYIGLRDDVRPEDCTDAPHSDLPPEVAKASEALEVAEETPGADGSSVPAVEHTAPLSELHLTNLGKIFWPEEGITKGELIDYYRSIAPALLHHLAGRPVVLVRYPDGIAGKNFYQWRVPEGAPSFMRSRELWDEEKQAKRGATKAVFLLDHLDALLYVINLGCIPLHVLASREASPRNCDFLTMDFDLGPRQLADAVQLALGLRDVLDELGLVGYPKTSGQRGLHVLIPLGPGVLFESAKLLNELLGRLIVARSPSVCTMERRVDKRGDKLYVDTGQTGQSRTIVAPYSVRAYPGATVSTPLSWEELHLALDPSLFDIRSVPERVLRLGDPMADLLLQRPNLTQTLSKLARWTGRGR